jgi:hypothetical protein
MRAHDETPASTAAGALKFVAFLGEPLPPDASRATLEWGAYQGNQVRFGELAPGDRFLTLDALWTKLSADTARRHSSASRALGAKGWGYHGDAVCSFERDGFVAFVPPTL